MMENLYILWDNKAQIMLKPLIVERNDVIPIRQLTDLANNPESTINKHASDYDLIHIGTIDTELPVPQSITGRLVINAADLLPAKE